MRARWLAAKPLDSKPSTPGSNPGAPAKVPNKGLFYYRPLVLQNHFRNLTNILP